MCRTLGLAIGLLAGCLSNAAAAQKFDIVIVGGRVIDPASGRDEIANVAINGRRIAAISRQPLRARRSIDARGLVVSPGFIDLHAHGQEPKAQRLQMQDGVTTALDMEAGAYPIEELYRSLAGKSVINFGGTVDWSCARIKVIANLQCHGTQVVSPVDATYEQLSAAKRATTNPDQERRIAALLRSELDKGALGYGLLLGYYRGAGRREIYEVFREAARNHFPVFVHPRTPEGGETVSGGPIGVVQELIADAAATGAAVQIVHVTSTGEKETPVILQMIGDARRRGIDISTEAYPYNAGSTQLDALAGYIKDGAKLDYALMEWPATGERLTRESFDRYLAQNPKATVVVHSSKPQEVVDEAILDPIVSIASDGMPWVTSGEHPRGAGTFSRVLGYYVREKGLDLKLALRKMTIMPARRLEAVSRQMARKGRLQVGADADITVFDPRTIRDVATYERPMQASAGIRFVLVNGVPTLADGKVVEGAFPGEPIRSNARANPAPAPVR